MFRFKKNSKKGFNMGATNQESEGYDRVFLIFLLLSLSFNSIQIRPSTPHALSFTRFLTIIIIIINRSFKDES